MHYMNGREAKVGDKVVNIDGSHVSVGVISQLFPGSTSCNATLVPYVNVNSVTIGNCVHVDDISKIPMVVVTPPVAPDGGRS